MITRLTTTILISLLLAPLASILATEEPKSQAKPNIVYVLADQWRASATGYAGDPNVKTPNLDRLAKESLNFAMPFPCCPFARRIGRR